MLSTVGQKTIMLSTVGVQVQSLEDSTLAVLPKGTLGDLRALARELPHLVL